MKNSGGERDGWSPLKRNLEAPIRFIRTSSFRRPGGWDGDDPSIKKAPIGIRRLRRNSAHYDRTLRAYVATRPGTAEARAALDLLKGTPQV